MPVFTKNEANHNAMTNNLRYENLILPHMTPKEIKLAQSLKELSIDRVKFTKLGKEIEDANNQARYVVDLLAYAVINRAIQMIERPM